MANNLTAVISADTSKFVEEVKSAQHMLNKFVKDSKSANKELGKSSPVSNEQVAAYQRVINVLNKVASGTMNTKQQQQALTESVKELKVQWSNLSDAAKSSGFGMSLADTSKMAQTELKALSAQIKLANEDISKIGNVAPGASLKRELRELQNTLQSLTNQYRLMSAAEKTSAQGVELAKKMDTIRQKAGELKDTIGDVSQEINVMASDTPNLDVFNDLLGIGADALSTYSSILAKVTGDEKALKNAIATVMAVQSAANLLTKVTNALQSSSAIMLKTRAIQEAAAAVAIKIKTAAETKGVVATKAATAAQLAFNAVAKANPYVLLATAVIGVGAALFAFSKSSNEATAAEKKAQEAAEEAKKSWKDFKDSVSNAGSSVMATYSRLQAEWNNLKSTYEKTQWIQDNKQEFINLGVQIDNVADAENFLVTNTDKVVQAFMLRAKAAAYAAKAQEMWAKYIDKEMEYNKKKVAAGDEVPRYAQPSSVTRDNNGRGNTANGGKYNVNNALSITSFTSKGAEEFNKKLRAEIGLSDEATSEIRQFTENQVALENEAQKLLKTNGIKPTTKSTKKTPGSKKDTKKTKVEVEYEDDSLDYWKAHLQKLQKELSSKKISLVDVSKTQQELNDASKEVTNWEDKVNKLKEQLKSQNLSPIEVKNIKKELNLATKQLNDWKDKVKALKQKLSDGELSLVNVKKIQDEIAKTQAIINKKEIELGIKPKEGSLEYIEQQISEIDSKLKKLDPKIDMAEIESLKVKKEGLEDAKKQVEKAISTVKVGFTSEAPQGSQQYAQDKVSYLKQKLQLSVEGTEEYNKIIEELKVWTAKEQDINVNVNTRLSNAKDGSMKFLSDKISNLQAKLEVEAYGTPEYNRINKELQELIKQKQKIEVQIDFDGKSALDKYDDITGAFRGVDGIVSSMNGLVDSIEDGANAWETFMGVVNVVDSVLNGVVSTIQAVDTVQKMLGATTEATSAIQTAATEQDVTNTATEVANSTTRIAVKSGEAIAGATASGAAMPFPLNLVAIAAGIAAVIAAISMIGSFANGGIIQGATTIGDYNLARVNSGEMILNGRQQNNLFRAIDENRLGGSGGAVVGGEVKIKGSDLYIALKNYSKVQGTLGKNTGIR
jgi:DNA repair exonuclease SbcCD ATPase subunit